VNPESRDRQRYHSENPDFSSRRGAVLVCTLRGHASVITDIDVSSDNALLATASEDGDVRIWGMTDGCPVAILRGHEGGANMVSVMYYVENIVYIIRKATAQNVLLSRLHGLQLFRIG
jgi:WD40 repeat protein